MSKNKQYCFYCGKIFEKEDVICIFKGHNICEECFNDEKEYK